MHHIMGNSVALFFAQFDAQKFGQAKAPFPQLGRLKKD